MFKLLNKYSFENNTELTFTENIFRSSKEKTKDASKEFTSKKVPTSSGFTKAKPPLCSKVQLTSCKPLQQDKMYQENKNLIEDRAVEGKR